MLVRRAIRAPAKAKCSVPGTRAIPEWSLVEMDTVVMVFSQGSTMFSSQKFYLDNRII
jgi:hypothetical protein